MDVLEMSDFVGKPFCPCALRLYLNELDFSTWKPTHVCIHHTAAPSLATRPAGFKFQHMENLQSYYTKELGWSQGPHLFVDEDEAWVLTPLNKRGVHAVSFNKDSWGLEMLGDYDSEDPLTGRGAQVLEYSAKITAVLLGFLKADTSKIRFHRDDPKTQKTCPGRKITKEHFTSLVKKYLLV